MYKIFVNKMFSNRTQIHFIGGMVIQMTQCCNSFAPTYKRYNYVVIRSEPDED